MGIHLHLFGTFIFVLLLVYDCKSYEKTLRKIVRDQFKMVQRPFSQGGGSDLFWNNMSVPSQGVKKQSNQVLSIYSQDSLSNKVYHHNHNKRPRISTVVKGDSKRPKVAHTINVNFGFDNEKTPVEHVSDSLVFTDLSNSSITAIEEHYPSDIKINNRQNSVNEVVKEKKTETVNENTESILQNIDQTANIIDKTIIIPENKIKTDEDVNVIKSIYSKNVQYAKGAFPQTDLKNVQADMNMDDGPDFLLEEVSDAKLKSSPAYNYNVSKSTCSCTILEEVITDIDTQEKFSDLETEGIWSSRKTYWDHIFDTRYETLMRTAKWPPLKVIMVPRSHVDTIWKQTFDQYHKNSVHRILSNIVKKLNYYTNMTFSWNEVSHLSEWWKTTNQKSRSAFRRLVKSGRLEITTGGWVEPDEATSHIFGLVHQLVEGHQWLKTNLNYSPKVAWLTNSVTHSPTMPYLLAVSGIWYVVFTNVHYAWEKYLAEFQYSDLIWLQSWDSNKAASSNLNNILNRIGADRFPEHAVLAHYLPFNSDGFKACGPSASVCTTDFNFAKHNKNLGINAYNVKAKAELLLEQYSKTGTLSQHNIVLAPIGDSFSYDTQSEFDYQYDNYQKIADFINMNKNIYKASVEFGTVREYFNTLLTKHKKYPTIQGDFMNFADITSGKPAYWTGFFTTRPMLKILLRRLQATLRTTELLFSFAISQNAFQDVNSTQIIQLLVNARKTVARLSDRNVLSGTISVNAMKSVYNQILSTAKDCWNIQEVSASLMSLKPGEKKSEVYLQKYVYRDGEFISVFRSIVPGDAIYLFNSLGHERTEVVELITMYPNLMIFDHNKKIVPIQVSPVWKHNSNKIMISRRFYKIIFIADLPSMALQLYKIKETYDAYQSVATVFCSSCVIDEIAGKGPSVFNIQPLGSGDIQIESYKHRLVVDEYTGLLKGIVQKDTNTERTVIIDYGAFKSSDENAGMFLFNTNRTKPINDILLPYKIGKLLKIFIIVSGPVVTEVTVIFGRLLQHTVRIYNLRDSPLSKAIYVESKVDYEASPKNRELELFLSIQSDINNGAAPELYTDNNGFQYTRRTLNVGKQVESNIYPMTTMTFIQDRMNRLSLVTDHAQGVSALQEGQLIVMLDRRILYNDGRGTGEGLADSSATCHQHSILLESFYEPGGQYAPKKLSLPSVTALHLSDSMNYHLDIFVMDRNHSNLCYYKFFPLIKLTFPSDISVLNFRTVISKECRKNIVPKTALLILHRQSFTCEIEYDKYSPCEGNDGFNLEDILRNIKAAYKTNLGGTSKGTLIDKLSKANFRPMEIITVIIHF